MLAAEVAACIAAQAGERGRRPVVRNGHAQVLARAFAGRDLSRVDYVSTVAQARCP